MALPAAIEPCLPSPGERPPTGPDRVHEIKYDGFRIITHEAGGPGGVLLSHPTLAANRREAPVLLLGAIQMATYYTKIGKRAWTATLRDCGFKDVRTSVVKFIWIIIGLAVAYLGGANVLTEQVGKFGTTVAGLLLVFIVLFSWNFLTAPSKLQQEADNEIAALKTKLNNREARQSAMARLWALRAEGTEMRNQKVVGSDAGEWIRQFENWRQRVLAEARTISPNFHAWLATLDRVRPGPIDLPQAATPEHNTQRSCQSEILLRMQEFLQAEMLHRDIERETS
jgi:hypothetical protein